jgi:hypothetical protein
MIMLLLFLVILLLLVILVTKPLRRSSAGEAEHMRTGNPEVPVDGVSRLLRRQRVRLRGI